MQKGGRPSLRPQPQRVQLEAMWTAQGAAAPTKLVCTAQPHTHTYASRTQTHFVCRYSDTKRPEEAQHP